LPGKDNLWKEEKQMSNMAATIEDLRNAAAAIKKSANWLAEQFSGNDPAPATVPAELVLTLEQVRAVLADKSRAGHTAAVRTLLQKHGADKLSEIDPTCYKALLDDAEVLGNG
jgi:hypothetical protein